MGRTQIADGDLLTGSSTITAPIRDRGKYSNYVISITGSAASGQSLPVDDALTVKLRRQLPDKNGKNEPQEIRLFPLHRINRYESQGGKIPSENVTGGNINFNANLRQVTPSLPGNVHEVTGPEDAEIRLDADIDPAHFDALRYTIVGETNPKGVEYYVRRLETTDIDLTGGSKDRQPTGNVVALYIRDPSRVIGPDGLDVIGVLGDREFEFLQEIGFEQQEELNQQDAQIPDSGLLANFTKVYLPRGSALEDHQLDYVDYELESTGNGKVYVTTDQVDFDAAFVDRSATTAIRQAKADMMAASAQPMTPGEVRRRAAQEMRG